MSDLLVDLESGPLEGRLIKMGAQLQRAPEHDSAVGEGHLVDYTLRFLSVSASDRRLDEGVDRSDQRDHLSATLSLAQLVGRDLTITFLKRITCIRCDRRIKKVYGDGLCFPCFQDAPSAAECVIRPALCRAHEGGGRDPDWEQRNHAQPHLVYMALSSHYKVGVTRDWPTRWVDQGAAAVKVIAETPYRQLAGEIEVSLSAHYRDKTAWQRMLKGLVLEDPALNQEVERAISLLPPHLQDYGTPDRSAMSFIYPSLEPIKRVKSFKLDKLDKLDASIRGGEDVSTYRGKLIGARGQYLIFSGGAVLNMRAHSGYHVRFALS